MFDVNQFVVIGKYTKMESHNNKSYLYLQTDNNGELRFIISNAIKDKLNDYCCVNDTMAVKGSISTNKNHSISLCATKISLISNKH